MNLNAQVFIYLDALIFFLLFKSNKWFPRSRALNEKDD